MLDNKKKVEIEEAFSKLGFHTEEILEIKQAKEKGQNFPLPDDRWYKLPTQYRAYYWGYINWVKSGKESVEPKVPEVLKEELTSPVSPQPLQSFSEEEKKGKETLQIPLRGKTKDNDEPRPISIVPPLPRFIKPPTQINRSDSTVSDSSLNSCSSQRSSFSATKSNIDNRNGANHYTQGYFPAINRNRFSPENPKTDVPSKVKTGGVSSAPSTPIAKRKDPNFFIRKNIESAGKSPRKNASESAKSPRPF
ncbi:MAG: hypothetical protein V4471_01650 [Pseudomonadota bacterium]